jgi:hypothetical protein
VNEFFVLRAFNWPRTVNDTVQQRLLRCAYISGQGLSQTGLRIRPKYKNNPL